MSNITAILPDEGSTCWSDHPLECSSSNAAHPNCMVSVDELDRDGPMSRERRSRVVRRGAVPNPLACRPPKSDRTFWLTPPRQGTRALQRR